MFALILVFVLLIWRFIFFFKQKTAYEMRISDWSSDVCSSDLSSDDAIRHSHPNWLLRALRRDWPEHWPQILVANNEQAPQWLREIGRASCRERVCQYV